MVNRVDKHSIIEKLTSIVQRDDYCFAVIEKFRGISASYDLEMRDAAYDNNVNIFHCKKSLLCTALKSIPELASISLALDNSSHSIAVVYSNDFGSDSCLVSVAKLCGAFSISEASSVNPLYAFYNENVIDRDDIMDIAKLPDLNCIRSRMLCTMMAVSTAFVRCLHLKSNKI